MKEYKHFMDLLKETGHFIDDKEDLPREGYSAVDFDPRRMIGLMLHSLLSDRPRANFYTDGKEIFYQNGGCSDINKAEDAIREDEILKILNAAPVDYRTLYGEADGHLRVDDFDGSFQREGPDEIDYDRYLESISKDVPEHLIRKDEKIQIRGRVKRYHSNLVRMINTLKADKELVGYALQLEDGLKEFDYNQA